MSTINEKRRIWGKKADFWTLSGLSPKSIVPDYRGDCSINYVL